MHHQIKAATMNIAGTSRGASLRKPLRLGGLNKGVDIDKLLESNSNNTLELNFYGSPPNYELSIDEFESLALARLKVSTLKVYFLSLNICYR